MRTSTFIKAAALAATAITFLQPSYGQLGVPLPKEREPIKAAPSTPAGSTARGKDKASASRGDGTTASTGVPKGVDNSSQRKDSPSKTLGRAGLQSGK